MSFGLSLDGDMPLLQFVNFLIFVATLQLLTAYRTYGTVIVADLREKRKCKTKIAKFKKSYFYF